MSIVICFNNKDPKPWQTKLQEKLKGVDIEIYPNIKDTSKVLFALCWKADKNILSQFPNLKVAQSVGASVTHIIKNQNLPENILVTRIVDEQLSEDMFEFILTSILSYMKNFPLHQLNKKDKLWHQKTYKTIKNTTICILGLGKIGTHVAKKLQNMGFKVKGWSKTAKKINNINCLYGNESLTNAITSTDILINILPLTNETENILNLKNLSKLNKNGYLINVGRGEHLVENDLLELINSKHLSGALLDVFRTEPLPNKHPFWNCKNISITPHVAALTNVNSAIDIIVKNYENSTQGKPLTNIVSVKKGY